MKGKKAIFREKKACVLKQIWYVSMRRREKGRGHSLNITNTLVFYCISHAKLVLFVMESDKTHNQLFVWRNGNVFGYNVLIVTRDNYLTMLV